MSEQARHRWLGDYPAGMRFALVIPVLVTLATSAAADTIVQFPQGTLYEAARASLMALDWQAAEPSREPGGGCSVGREAVCARYPETHACSNEGLGRCSFLWRKGDHLIQVETLGVDAAELVVDRTVCIANC